jgi:hypothetical protein
MGKSKTVGIEATAAKPDRLKNFLKILPAQSLYIE